MQKEHCVPLIDTGNTKEFVVSGLGLVTKIDAGWAEFSFFRSVVEEGEHVRLVKVKLIAPIAAVPAAIGLCATVLGPGVLTPSAALAPRLLS